MPYGAIIGDVLGSSFEFDSWRKAADALPFFPPGSRLTDDSILTTAVADALLASEENGEIDRDRFGAVVGEKILFWAQRYPGAGYGGRFMRWMLSPDRKPYGSLGNGSAMRVSPCAWAAKTLEEALELARLSALPTHNHPEGIAGAQAAAWLTFQCRQHASEPLMRLQWNEFWLDSLGKIPEIEDLAAARPIPHDSTCSGTVPIAVSLVLETFCFEDTVRCAVALGGDCDTIAAIAGAAAEARWGVPLETIRLVRAFMGSDVCEVIERFDERFG